jgi:hypothetical protein
MLHSSDLYEEETNEPNIARNIQELVTNCRLNMALLYIHAEKQKSKIEAAKALVLLTGQ